MSEYELELIKEFANIHNIHLMGSRPVVENNILNRENQIGQSGRSISAKLYVAIGISGAPQHLVGIRNCKKIIAINIDKNALIHEYANYSFVCSAKYFFERIKELER